MYGLVKKMLYILWYNFLFFLEVKLKKFMEKVFIFVCINILLLIIFLFEIKLKMLILFDDNSVIIWVLFLLDVRV